jgi:hypothetical protein
MSNLKYQTTTSTPNYRIRFNNFRIDCTERLISDYPQVWIASENTDQYRRGRSAELCTSAKTSQLDISMTIYGHGRWVGLLSSVH